MKKFLILFILSAFISNAYSFRKFKDLDYLKLKQKEKTVSIEDEIKSKKINPVETSKKIEIKTSTLTDMVNPVFAKIKDKDAGAAPAFSKPKIDFGLSVSENHKRIPAKKNITLMSAKNKAGLPARIAVPADKNTAQHDKRFIFKPIYLIIITGMIFITVAILVILNTKQIRDNIKFLKPSAKLKAQNFYKQYLKNNITPRDSHEDSESRIDTNNTSLYKIEKIHLLTDLIAGKTKDNAEQINRYKVNNNFYNKSF